MNILPDPQEEAYRIVRGAARQNLTFRLLGGAAISLHSPSASHWALARSYPDLDFVLREKRGDRAEMLLAELGYLPDKPFNLYNGHRRLLFHDAQLDRQVDIFVGEFHMCHTIPLGDRLELEPITVPLAELLLTKLQIVQMNEKDVRDVCALVLDHPLGDRDAEMLNEQRIASLCADDWGLWRTVGLSLEKVLEVSQGFSLGEELQLTLGQRLASLRQALEAAPKSTRWRMRARVGDRVQWYELPEEVRRA
jgi:hypothetical protein